MKSSHQPEEGTINIPFASIGEAAEAWRGSATSSKWLSTGSEVGVQAQHPWGWASRHASQPCSMSGGFFWMHTRTHYLAKCFQLSKSLQTGTLLNLVLSIAILPCSFSSHQHLAQSMVLSSQANSNESFRSVFPSSGPDHKSSMPVGAAFPKEAWTQPGTCLRARSWQSTVVNSTSSRMKLPEFPSQLSCLLAGWVWMRSWDFDSSYSKWK